MNIDPTVAKYSPLNDGEIRVLCLQPGEYGSPLVAALQTIPIGRNGGYPRPDYDAISYAWGSDDRTHELIIQNGGNCGITVSLYEALQQLRHAKMVRRLWADAVCINQFDKTEKAVQVKSMHQVYVQAKMVIVWLGLKQETDALAAATIAACPDTNWHDQRGRKGGLTDLREVINDDPMCPCCKERYDQDADDLAVDGFLAVARLLTRSWFSRLWVVQEVSNRFADTEACFGPHRVTLEKLQHASAALRSILDDPTDAPLRLFGISSSEAGVISLNASRLNFEIFDAPTHVALSSRVLWRQLSDLSRRECKVPRDRVYALRKCLGLDKIPDLDPDYESSTDTAEIYRRFSCALMTRANFTGEPRDDGTPWTVLALIGTEAIEAKVDPRPSWVPHFHYFTDRSRMKIRNYVLTTSSYAQFRAVPARFEWRQKADKTRIQVRGRIYGTLEAPLSDSKWPDLLPKESTRGQEDDPRLRAIILWYRFCKDIVHSSVDLRGRSESMLLHKLLSCGQIPTPTATFQCACGTFGMLERQLRDGWLPADVTNMEHDICHFIPYLFSVQPTESETLDRGRLLCRLSCDGVSDVGWVPRVAQAGDRICVIGGAPYPFVVRPRLDGSLELLGDAYTVTGTLKQALGGSANDTRGGNREILDPFMDWKTDRDDSMVQLMDQLDWITLS